MEQNVAVHKSAIELATGESLKQFTTALTNACREHVKMKLNSPNSYAYVVEVFGSALIVETYKEDDKESYYAMSYKRDKYGKFEFGDMQEVERFTSYRKKAMPITKAVWTAAFINTLPDAAFAIVLPGGKKDKEGKTTPRSLRMLPHHNANVKSPSENSSVDKVHLANALARVSQSKMSAQQIATAKSHLQAHAKALLPSYKTPVKKELDGCPGWTLTSKAFWSKIL